LGLAGTDYYADAYTDTYGVPFPSALLDLKYEILVNGTWTDITDFVYSRNDTVITVPRGDETTQATYNQVTFTLNNQDGRFSPENRIGVLFPFTARNIQCRISVGMDFAASSYSGYRFWGEVTTWTPQQDATGNDQFCDVLACGVLRRYNQGAKIGSALRRYYSRLIGSPLFPYAAWPCEDGGQTTELGSMVTDVPGMVITGAPQFSSNTSFGGSDALPVVAGSVWHGLTEAAEFPSGSGSLTEFTPGTYKWTAPPAVTSVDCSNTGAGGGGGWTAAKAAAGGGGGGAGESAADASVAVSAGSTYTYVVPSGGAPGTSSDIPSGGGAGGNATFTGDSVTVTAHGGKGGRNGGSAGGAGGAGGTGSANAAHHNGGAGGLGSTNAAAVFSRVLTGKAGATGGGNSHTAGTVTTTWKAPFGTTTVSVPDVIGAGGGGGGGDGATGGGGGGGGGGFSQGTVNVTPGTTYTVTAGNGGNGGNGGAQGLYAGRHGDAGGSSSFVGDPGSGVGATSGGGGGTPAGGSGGPGTGGNGGPGGTGGASASAWGGGGGGGGSNGSATLPGANGEDGSNRTPGAASGSGGAGGWGRILTGGGAGSGQSAGRGGGNGSSVYGGGGGGGGATDDASGGTGTNGGGGAPGYVKWSWTNDGATGGGGGSSGGTSSAGNTGLDTGAGGAAVTGGGAGGDMDFIGGTPGGGGGGMDPSGSAPGTGAPGQVSFSWSGGPVSPVPAAYIRFLLEIPAGGETDGAVIARAVAYGDIVQMDVVYHTGGKLRFIGYDSGASIVFDSGSVAFLADGQPMLVSANTQTYGTTVSWALKAIIPGALSATVYSGTVSGYALGNVSDVYVNPNGTLASTTVGWVTVQDYCDTIESMGIIIGGYNDELAADRLARLCAEEGFGFTLMGLDSDTPQMGPQQDDTFVNVLQSCEDADRGILFESSSSFGLTYRPRVSMQGQSPAVILDWGAGQLAQPVPVPVTDDQRTRNDITLTRSNGSSVTAVLNDGSLMGVGLPPNGVGDYTYSLTVFLFADSQLANMAAWMLMVGTVPWARYPSIAVDLARSEVQDLTAVIPALGHGDWVEVVNPPSQLTPGPIDQLLYGWTEVLNSTKWTFAYNLVPEAPYSEPNPPTW
jgi:hypothetical protein